MPLTFPSGLSAAAEARRRELPASVAVTILTGGLTAAIMGGSSPVMWAGTMSLLLIVDAEIYRRLDLSDARLEDDRIAALLAGWAFLMSMFYATLPTALWLNGSAAGAAAATVLWVTGAVRYFGAGAGRMRIALAGAAPPAMALLLAPFALAFLSYRPDWDVALIAAVGGGALMVYVAQARLSAAQAERTIRESARSENLQQTLAQLLFDQAAVAAFLLDRDGRVVAMSRYEGEGAPNCKIEAVCPWVGPRWRSAFARALKGQHAVSTEEFSTAEGERWFEWAVQPWRGADGEICGVITHGRDITALVQARRRADDYARELDQARTARDAALAATVAKSNFLSSMSHELRTPLNAIIGYSEMLQEEAQADGRANDQADLERVLSSARQLLHLINDILDISKIEAGRMEISSSDFDLKQVIEQAAGTIRPAMEKNGNKLHLDLAPGLGVVCTDEFKLTQCLLNFLSNAAKFTKDGEVWLSARVEEGASGDGWIEVRVRDTGIGMTEAQLDRIFDSYEQAEATTAARFGGTGLGLAITRRLLRLMGGDAWADSKPGVGSTFFMRIPARLASSRVEPVLVQEPSDAAGRVALVIDDDNNARQVASRSLARLGFIVHEAASGAAGLDLARAEKPHIILLDIRLPDISGWDVLAALRREDGVNAPVIVHSVESDRQRAIALGACEMLVKPVNRDILAAAALRFAGANQSFTLSAHKLTQALAKAG
ncbi:MAG: ATP-binding protein [Hyphomonadaceae bacterium]|nr:ATP-binding protein [Hyphomonadaceae bacterium]